MNWFKSIKNKKGMSGAVKGAMLILTLAFAIASVSYIMPALANTHTATVNLGPVWSPAGEHIDFNSTFCWTSGDKIHEVRIYKNWDGSINYTNFECADKPGWEKLYISTYPACFYVASDEPNELDSGHPCETFYFSAHSPGPEYCNLEWKFETRDINDYWQYEWAHTSVDDTKPIITKDFVGPKSGPCPPGAGEECWVSIGTMTTIKISVEDEGLCGKSGLDYCKVTYTIDGGSPIQEVYADLNGEMTWQYDMKFKEDSLHVLKVECKDIANNILIDEERFKVDGTPPVTTKTYGNPHHPSDINTGGAYPHYINSSTPITLTAVDGGSICHIGVDKTYWRNTVLTNNEPCENPTVCQQAQGSGSWHEYTTPFTKPEESCHLIEYYSVDLLGNAETPKKQCVYVDNKPPTGTKTISDPKIQLSEKSFWVGRNTNVTLSCIDPEPHPVDHAKVCYKIGLDGGDVTSSYCTVSLENGWCCVDSSKIINFKEDSQHTLEYYCKDALGNTNTPDLENFKVDSNPPVITKTLIGPKVGTCPPRPGHPEDVCYIKDTTGGDGTIIHVEAIDPDPTGKGCNVNEVKCEWFYYLDSGTEKLGFHDDKVPPFNITFSDDSTHKLNIKCFDKLGNIAWDNETFLVDSISPVTTKTYGNPHYPSNINSGAAYPHYINSSTPITLTATDAKVGVDKIYWRNTVVEDRYCQSEASGCQNGQGSGDWNNVAGTTTTIYKPEESCHMIEFYAVDKLGNEEIHHKQCVFVDNTAPIINKTVGQPQKIIGDKTYIINTTPITLSCTDTLPHPVDNVSIWYRYRISNDCLSWGEWTTQGCADGVVNGWCDGIAPNQKTIYFPQDSCHQLEYYCQDSLGNKGQTLSEIDVVDSKPPVITRTIIGPKYLKDNKTYIDGVTNISINSVDQDPHPVGNVTCDWWYYLDGSGTPIQGVSGITPSFVINFPEETKHELHVKCKDVLGNSAEYVETFYVDKTKPITTKTYGTPFYTDGTSEWITSATPITLSVEDAGPHKTGIKETKYRITLLGDNKYCENKQECAVNATGSGSWQTYTTNFSIPQDSCHLIEYYSKDNVDKTEDTKKQCVFVDNKPPLPNKTVGQPKSKWTPGVNGQEQSYFYLEETAHCWDGTANEIECWKVTTLTAISLDCEDQQPHPVDHEKVCYQVGLDGKDATGKYCNAVDGWCCEDKTIKDFYFTEETEHNLKYYCVDALGNKGPVDEEKFKVEGKPFEIPLHEKWNLISVPFTLFNDNPDEVFQDIKSDIKSVWTYDPEHQLCNKDWCVYIPGGDGDDTAGNLQDIIPGWGYWVLADNCTTLKIAGSLFSPRSVPPSRNLVKGWNLIGYYGTEWQSYEEDASCGGWSHGYGGLVYCSLNSLIDTQEGYPRWSSLWTFKNCRCEDGTDNCCYCEIKYGTDSCWTGLNTCTQGTDWNRDKMYAGSGYWIEMDVPDLYSPATTCVWNKDFQCIQTTKFNPFD